MDQAIAHHEEREHGVGDDEVAHDLEHEVLEVAARVRRTNQFGGPTEIGANTGGGDLSCGLASADHRAGEHRLGRTAGDGGRLSRQHRLVDLDRAVHEVGVRGHDVAHPDVEPVPGNEIAGGESAPGPVSLHPREDLETLAQHIQRRTRPLLLGGREQAVEHEQARQDRRRRVSTDQQFEHERHLQHPRDRPPQLRSDSVKRAGSFGRNLVRAEDSQTALGLAGAEPLRGGPRERRRDLRGRRGARILPPAHALSSRTRLERRGRFTPYDRDRECALPHISFAEERRIGGDAGPGSPTGAPSLILHAPWVAARRAAGAPYLLGLVPPT